MQLFPGVQELLAAAAGNDHVWRSPPARAAAAWTARSTPAACGRYFAASRCADETSPKPHPAMLLELMDELECRQERSC